MLKTLGLSFLEGLKFKKSIHVHLEKTCNIFFRKNNNIYMHAI